MYADRERHREVMRLYQERKRRERGVMEKKPPRSVEEIRAARRVEASRLREIAPDHVRELKRKSMVKRRIADNLGIDISEVPADLFAAKCAQLDVIRKVKELLK